MFATTAALAALLPPFPPTVTLQRTGQHVSLFGKGRPVVFSSGLFGTMPRRIYSALFRHLAANLTLVVLNEPAPVTLETVEDIANTLAVDQLGFFSHSSIDVDILQSARIRSAVLCDPVTFPRISVGDDLGAGFGLVPPTVAKEMPFLVLRAARAYDGDGAPAIPEFLCPRLPPDWTREQTFADVGHADLLDDTWADFGSRAIPWMRGVVARTMPYTEWEYRGSGVDARDVRRDYRARVAAEAVAHLLADPSPKRSGGNAAADGTLVKAEQPTPPRIALTTNNCYPRSPRGTDTAPCRY